MILDFHQDHRQADNQATGKESPARGEEVDVRLLDIVKAPYDRCAGGLDTLVETRVIGKLAAVVGQSTHVPIFT